MEESDQSGELNFAGADLAGADFFKADLAGANFTGADLRGANFAYANLQGATLMKAQLGAIPSSYMGRVEGIYSALAVVRADDLTHVHDLSSSLAGDLTRAHELSTRAAYGVALGSALKHAAEVADTLSTSHDLNHCLALVGDLNRSLAHALSFAAALPATLGGDRSSTDASAFASIHSLISSLGGGAIFYGAELTGVTLIKAELTGAIMTRCIGLSSSEVASLERRGAVFEDNEFPLG